MKPSVQKVLGIMQKDGHITRIVATHYNIGCVRKAVSELRDAGYVVLTEKRKDANGDKYTRWVLVNA
jgi:hypothetical protein